MVMLLATLFGERPMADAAVLGLGLLDRSPTAEAPIERLRPASHAAQVTMLPAVEPGQFWWVELRSTDAQFAPLEYRALQNATVVVYDRSLADTVARALPLGGYAEPATARDGRYDSALERCLHFARDGWSVVRLIDYEATSQFVGRQEMTSIRRLLAANEPASSPVLIFANSGDAVYERGEATLDSFDQMIAKRSSAGRQTLTIVFGAIGGETAPRFSVASSNGLAG
jgi:hypothetical protein